MNTTIITTLIGAVAPGIVVGLVCFYWERRQKKKDAENKAQRDLSVEQDLLRLDLEVATAQLSFAVAMAIKRGTPNGEMEVALEKYNHAIEKFRKFERKQLILHDNE